MGELNVREGPVAVYHCGGCVALRMHRHVDWRNRFGIRSFCVAKKQVISTFTDDPLTPKWCPFIPEKDQHEG